MLVSKLDPEACSTYCRHCAEAAFQWYEDQLLPDRQRASGRHGPHGSSRRASNGRAGRGPLGHRGCKHRHQDAERVWHSRHLEERPGTHQCQLGFRVQRPKCRSCNNDPCLPRPLAATESKLWMKHVCCVGEHCWKLFGDTTLYRAPGVLNTIKVQAM